MRKLPRNLATGLAAGALAVGAMLPALAQDAPGADEAQPPVATDHDPVQARVHARDAVRDPEMTLEEREARIAERQAFREERDAQHEERVEAAVEAGDLTQEQAQEMREAREQRVERGARERGAGERGAGPRGPGAGNGAGAGGPGEAGPGEGGRGGGGMGPRDGSGPNEDCLLD